MKAVATGLCAGLAPELLVSRGRPSRSASSNRIRQSMDNGTPSILVFVLDALSARNMSLYGYERRTTPNLERFSCAATVFHRHHSAATFTSPSVASLLTGAYPWAHRCINHFGIVRDDFGGRNLFGLTDEVDSDTFSYTQNRLANLLLMQFGAPLDFLLPNKWLTISDRRILARVFSDDPVISAWSELLMRRQFGTSTTLLLPIIDRLRERFGEERVRERYAAQFPRGIPSTQWSLFRMEEVVDFFVAWIGRRKGGVLAYVHFIPPHDPYNTRVDFVDLFADSWIPPRKAPGVFSQGYTYHQLMGLRRRYDEYIAYADAELGRLLDMLLASGALENAYVIITSDHGEMFERGIWQHMTPALYEPLLHIPLIVSAPGQIERKDVYDLTSSLDLMPTILSLLDLPIPDWCAGEHIRAICGGKSNTSRRVFAMDAKDNPKYGSLSRISIAMYHGDYKLTGYLGYAEDDQFELFNIREDPEELAELSSIKSSQARHMRNELLAKIGQVEAEFGGA
jgi:hypothetical protein